MSHFSLIKIKIKNPNTALLKKAVELIAKEMNAEVVSEVRDYYGHKISVITGIANTTFHRGIGVDLSPNGEVTIIGDFYNVPHTAVKRFQQLLVQYYASLAMQQALAQLGYQVQAQKVQEKVYIRGVAL
jgi:hypothetical protein